MGFDRARLPEPAAYFDSIGLRLGGAGRWRSALCPFHEDKTPSLRVQIEVGAFKCMSCGAKGGDVLAFEQQRTGLKFREAAQSLGAWS